MPKGNFKKQNKVLPQSEINFIKSVARKEASKIPAVPRGILKKGNVANIIKNLDKKINGIRSQQSGMFSARPKKERSREPSYMEGILYPETNTGAKIPGTSVATVPFHRRVTITASANALGNIGILWQPTSLNDIATATSTLYINSSLAYDGVSVLGVNALSVATNFGLTTGAIVGYRLVSASIHLKTNASVLNSQGKINSALVSFRGVEPKATGTTLAAATGVADNFLFIPNFESTINSGIADVEKGQSARVIWVPTFPTHKNFLEPNTNYQTGTTGASLSETAMVLVATGLAANQLMTMDLYVNYELQPAPGSVLQGMETICQHPQQAETEAFKVMKYHQHDLVMAYDAARGYSGSGYRANNKGMYQLNSAYAISKGSKR